MGKIELDHTGSGGGITLSSDGTDLLLNGTAVGGGGSSTITVDSKTAAYTIVSGDVGKLISFSGGSYTVSLTAASTLGNGFYVYIENNAAAGQQAHVVTIDPDASETIDGRSTMPLRQGQRILIVCDGSNWKTVADFNRAIATNARIDFFNLPQATGDESVAIGLGSVASNTNTTAIGLNAEATGSYATSFGMSSEATAFGSIAAGYNAVSAGSQSIALGVSRASGDDSFAAAIASNSSTYGATGANSIAMGYLSKATSDYSIAIGRENIAQSNLSSSAIGGKSNTASGHYSIIAGGNLNTATQSRSAVIGGQQNNATGQYSFVGGGLVNTASGQYSTALGGYGNMASGDYSFAHGRYAKADIEGKLARASGRFAATGDAQGGKFILRADTTDATATVLTTNNSTAGSTNQIVAASDTCITFDGTITAMQNGAQAYASWKIEGLLVNDGGTTTLANSATTVIQNLSSWGMALSADNTNNALAITVTGEAAHNIRWVANIRTTEVTYA